MISTAPKSDRFTTPLYSVFEASQYVGVAPSTFRSWASGYVRRSAERPIVLGDAIVTTIPGQPRGAATIPFVGLAEGLVLAGVRRAGVPLQRIRPALDRLQAEFGLEHVLASKQLYTDGAEVLYDFAEQQQHTEAGRSARQLVVVRNNQHVFSQVVDQYLRRIEFGADNYAQVLHLPGYDDAEVVADPRRGFGQPTFQRGGARVEDVLGMFWAGESLATVAAEYGVPLPQLEAALRVTSKRAA